jgi:hypothetical protein
VTDACYLSAEMVCTQVNVPASAKAQEDSACTSESGMPMDTCPTAALAGCCRTASISESCYYGDLVPTAEVMQACTTQGSTWSTTP